MRTTRELQKIVDEIRQILVEKELTVKEACDVADGLRYTVGNQTYARSAALKEELLVFIPIDSEAANDA